MNIVNPNKEYKKGNNVVYSCQYHVVFCSKYRRPVLTEKIANKLKEIVINKQIEYQYNIIEIEVMSDHVHLLIGINPKIGVYPTVTKIKGATTRLLREEFPELKSKLPTL